MLNLFSRTLIAGALGLSLIVSQHFASDTPAMAQTDAPTPPLILTAEATPEALPESTSLLSATSPITPTSTPEFSPEQAVREIKEKGRAILYPGHILTPTENFEEQEEQHETVPSVAEGSLVLNAISGTVTVSDTGLPVSNVRVVVYKSGDVYDQRFTNRQGKFSVPIYSSGNYAVRVDPSQVYPYDLAGEWYDDQTLSNTATLISSTLGSSALAISLNRGGQITGTIVTSDTGTPLAGITVAVYDANGTFLQSVLSDDAGRYTTSGLSSGSYTLCTFAFYEATALTQKYYPGGCYDHQPSLASATPLSVTAPNTLPDITLAVPSASQITGVVTAAETGTPLAGVEVYILGKTSPTGQYTVTNSSGQYVLDSLAAGAYTLYFSTRVANSALRKYISEFYDSKQTIASADVITLTASATLSNVNATLDLGSHITGVVTARDTGASLGGIKVDLLTTGGGTIGNATTNVRGEYDMGGLAKGQYKLFFSTRNLSSFDNPRNYFSEYYNRQQTLAAADVITLTAATTLSNVNAALGVGGRITGVVTAEDTGAPLNNVSVILFNLYGAFINRGSTNALGEYTFSNLSTGQYKLYFFISPLPFQTSPPQYFGQYYPDKLTLTSASPVSVTVDQTMGGINTRLNRGGQVTGVVTGRDTGRGLNAVQVNFSRSRLNRDYSYEEDFYEEDFSGSTFTDADGHYTMTTPGGLFNVYFRPYYNFVPYCGRYADSISVTPKQTTSNINGVLDHTSRISGTVTAVDGGAPLARVYVSLLPADGFINFESYAINFGSTNAQGHYNFDPLCAGQYKIYLDSSYGPTQTRAYASSYYNQKPTFEAAEVINLASGVTLTLNSELAQLAQITGTVTAADTGLPVSSAFVRVFDMNGKIINSRVYGINRVAGSYTVTLAPGSYKLYADASSNGTYASEFYSATASFGEALTLTIAPKQVLGNINFELQRSGVITGKVTDEDTGYPMKYEKVFIFDASNPNHILLSTYTDQDGVYETRGNLRMGNYKVLVSISRYLSRYYGGSLSFDAATPVSVTSELTTPNINIQVLSIQSPKLSTRLRLPIVMRPVPGVYQIAPTPFVNPTTTLQPTYTPYVTAPPAPLATATPIIGTTPAKTTTPAPTPTKISSENNTAP